MSGSPYEPPDPSGPPGDGPVPPPPPPYGAPPPYYGAPPPPPPPGGYPPGPYPPGPYPPGPYGYGPPGAPQQLSPQDERNWALGVHLSVFVLQFLGPLLVMLIQGPKSAFVRHHAVEALNFSISMAIYSVVSVILMLALIGFILLPVVLVGWFVFTIIACVKASQGEWYRYPLNIRLVT